MQARSTARRGFLALVFLLVLAGAAAAQEGGAEAEAAAAPAVDDVAEKLAALESQAKELRAQREEWAARAAEYEKARTEGPEQVSALEKEIAALTPKAGAAIDAGAGADELEAKLVTAEQDLALARKESAELEAKLAARPERRKQIPKLVSAAKERLAALAEAPAAPTGEDPRLAEARAQVAAARRETLEAEIDAYEKEIASYEARGKLLGARIDRANARIGHHEAAVLALRAALTAVQQGEARRAAEQAIVSVEEAELLSPELREVARDLAKQNVALAERRTGEQGLLGQIDDVSEKLERAKERVAELDADYARLTSKVAATGLSDSLGLLLRKKRAEAPDVGKYRRFIRMRRDEINAVQTEQLELRDRRRELADIEGLVAREMARLGPEVSEADRARIEALLRDLLETRRRSLDALLADYEAYFEKLVDFDARQQELIEKTEKLVEFIDARILWVPSGGSVHTQLLMDGFAALEWLTSPTFWGQWLRALRRVTLGSPLWSALAVLVALLAVAIVRRARPRLRLLGQRAAAPTCTDYAPTAEAFALTLLIVPWLPGLLGYLGWQLRISPAATQFVRAIADGMQVAAVVWLTLELPRQLMRRGGIAESHFGWPVEAVRSLRRHLSWLAALGVPALFLVGVFESRAEEAWKESVGRLAFLVAMGGAVVFTHAVVKAPKGALARIVAASELDVPPWMWRGLHVLALAAPVSLMAAALRGYFWTALELAARIHFSLFFLLILGVFFLLSMRWSLMARRRLYIEEERARRERLAADAQQLEHSHSDEAPSVAEPQLDLADVDAQTSRLLNTTTLLAGALGLWLIWASVFPAVGILREVELWNTTQMVTVETEDASGAALVRSEERIVPVTLADLSFGLLIAVVTLVMVRNLPGLLEMAVLRRLPISAGERYAYATLAKYALTLAGLALAFGTVGIGWSNIQWLVAAVGLGLGFGLQEIFANFVSGLIILFERPMRVGDTVTVGSVSGTVSKIRIRATWITGFDRKELVVPNKEFVTTQLVNWSLSDRILRVEIPVGIAYGSDTELTIRTLREVADRNEHVLRDPHPVVYFLGFGDSSLSFELRCFSPDVERRLQIVHELHMEIDRAFRAAGIEIAFPQRDLHVRTLPQAPPPPSGGDA